MLNKNNTIGVVMVTFNRLNYLKESLKCYEDQKVKPIYIIVVNNNSSDGTREFLEEWEKTDALYEKIVINLDENIGGSGGFNIAINKALELEADWVWIADDDAFPQIDCFYELQKFADSDVVKQENIVSICSRNMNAENIDITHRWRLGNNILGKRNYPVPITEYKKDYFFIDIYSFVGAAVKKDVLKIVGAPRRDFFIYGDDFEHAVRVRMHGKIVCVPNIIVQHQNNNSSLTQVSWRDYYDTRNVLWIYKTHFGMYPFFVRAILRIITALRSGNIEKVKVFLVAIKDAYKGKTGLHNIYKPGWVPLKK